MKVRVCVRQPPRSTHTSYHHEIWHDLLISPGLKAKPVGDPKRWPQGLPRIVTPSKNPWKVKHWAGASKQKLLLEVGLPDKILFLGAYSNPRPTGLTPPKGVFALRIGMGPVNKSCSLGWGLYVKYYIWGPTPTWGPWGVFAFEQFS